MRDASSFSLSLIFNLRSLIIKSHIFSMFSSSVNVVDRQLRGSSSISSRPGLNSTAQFFTSYQSHCREMGCKGSYLKYVTFLFTDCLSPSHPGKHYIKESHFLRKLSIGNKYAISIFCIGCHEPQRIQNSSNLIAAGF